MNAIKPVSKLKDPDIYLIRMVIKKLTVMINNWDEIRDSTSNVIFIDGFFFYKEYGICLNVDLYKLEDIRSKGCKNQYYHIKVVNAIAVEWCLENNIDSITSYWCYDMEVVTTYLYFISGVDEYFSEDNLYENIKRLHYAIYLRNNLIDFLNNDIVL